MGAFSDIATFLVSTIGGLFFWAVLLRFLLQLARADFYNPISQSLVRITNPVLKPLRRLIPGLFGLDMAALVLAIVVKLVIILTLVLLNGVSNPNILVLLIWAVVACAITVLNIYYIAMLATIILSWVAAGSRHPAVHLIHQIAEPVLAPFRRLLPAMGGIDFSPMLAFIAIYVVQIVMRYIALAVGLDAQFMFGGLLRLPI